MSFFSSARRFGRAYKSAARSSALRSWHSYRRSTKRRAYGDKLDSRHLTSRQKKRWRKHGKGTICWL